MKLTRTVHVGGVQAFFATASELVPDINLVAPDDGDPADRCLMFVDVANGEAHGFLFTEREAGELAAMIARPRVETFRTFPGELLNGDTPPA